MAEGNGEALNWLDELTAIVRELHDDVLNDSGGLAGEHGDKVEGACARPFHTAFGEFLFKSQTEMAAALFHGIICDHVFVDGNKRTACIVAVLFLTSVGFMQSAPTTLQVRFLGELAVETASGGLDVHAVAKWLERIFAPM